MQTETANNSSVWNASRARQSPLARLFDVRLALVLLLALLAGSMAYQARPLATIQVGWLGDQLFLPSSQGLGDNEAQAGRWFGDERTDDAPTQRSRWTRSRALVTLPGLGARRDATLLVQVQGWPANAVRSATDPAQPTVAVRANGVLLAPFMATADWREHRLTIPAAALAAGDLQLEFTTPTFTATQTSNTDPRAKGIRVAQIRVVGGDQAGFAAPPLGPLALLGVLSLLGYLALTLIFRRPTVAFVLAIVLASGAALGLALTRVWMVALLPWLVGAVLLALLICCWPAVSGFAARFAAAYARGGALTIGLGAALLAWLAYLLVFHAGGMSRGITWKNLTAGMPDTLLLALLGASLLLLLMLRGANALGRVTQAIVGALASRRGALVVLGLFGAVWLGYEAWMLAALPGVGHADYADNAVVARNLVRGRGWVVDYVTQFYQLYPNGVTRPQETWPIMQPVWIAPFFALLGVNDFAARLPNLIFTAALGGLVYWFGARVWDRRVGLTAAILLLTNYLFFLLVINATSDLAFVVFSFAALALVYRWGTGFRGQGTGDRGQVYWRVIGAGILTGLMLVQKPANGAFMALGISVWLLVQLWRARPQAGTGRRMAWRSLAQHLAPIALWALIALLILSPYLARNMATFGKLFYSTESHDAWVSGYDADWEAIYKVYTPEYGLSETKGLPERSWLLRYGFDRTLAKIADQVAAVRNYLVPPWRNLPLGLSALVSGTKDGPAPGDSPLPREDARLLFGVGAWLALLGLLLALRRHSALIRLLALAFAPYTLFLVLYWHADEPRYFVALMPWIALLAAVAIWGIYDRFAHAGGRWAPVGLMFALVLVLGVVSPSWPIIEQKITEWHYADGDRDTYAWLKANTAPGDVMMTRVPWQLNWHSDRPAVMVPYTPNRTTFFQLARYYKARYLVMDVGQRPDKNFVLGFLNPLIDDPKHLFTLKYTSPEYGKGKTLVYEFPADYGGVPELRL